MQRGFLSMEAIAETAAIIDVATHRFLTQLREFDVVDGWHRAGALSCAHWLSWRVGMDLGAAREKVRVARKLGDLPVIDEALRKGEISYSKVRAMTRVATGKNEGELLGMARCATGAQIEKICRLKRMVNALAGEAAKEVEGRRYVVERPTEDGMVSIQLRLLPEEAAKVMKALEVAGSGNRADEPSLWRRRRSRVARARGEACGRRSRWWSMSRRRTSRGGPSSAMAFPRKSRGGSFAMRG